MFNNQSEQFGATFNSGISQVQNGRKIDNPFILPFFDHQIDNNRINDFINKAGVNNFYDVVTKPNFNNLYKLYDNLIRNEREENQNIPVLTNNSSSMTNIPVLTNNSNMTNIIHQDPVLSTSSNLINSSYINPELDFYGTTVTIPTVSDNNQNISVPQFKQQVSKATNLYNIPKKEINNALPYIFNASF